MTAIRDRRSGWGTAGAIVAVWVVISLISASQYVGRSIQENRPARFWFSFWLGLGLWSYWALASPAVLRLGRALPVTSTGWALRVALHTFVAVVFGLGHVAFIALVNAQFLQFPGAPPATFGSMFVRGIPLYGLTELVFYWAILGVATTFEAQRRGREKELRAAHLEAQLNQFRLQALQMQIQPHFLYNSLNTVAMMARSGENQDAVEMIAKLGELLRGALGGDSSQEVTLAEEVAFVERYLAIEQYRFGETLQVRIDVPTELGGAAVPRFILQPLVENAVRHGAGQETGTVLIQVTARREGDALRIDVLDDGPGLAAGWTWESNSGIGLRNVRDRLELLYGAKAQVEIEGRRPRGVRAGLRTPFEERVAP